MPEGTKHIDAALSNISIAYRNGVFIAERVLPVVPVLKQSDKYYTHGKEAFNVLDDRRSAGSEARTYDSSTRGKSLSCRSVKPE